MKYKPRHELAFLLDDQTTDALAALASQHMPVVIVGENIHDRYFGSTVGGRSPSKPARQRQYRVRQIGCSWQVFLESRTLSKSMSSLRRTTIPSNETVFLDAEHFNEPWAGKWFQKKMKKHGLTPWLAVEFTRTALQTQSLDGDIRLTIDRNLSAQQIGDRDGTAIAFPSNIVRMKYFVSLPAVCKALIYSFGLLPECTSALQEYRRLQAVHHIHTRSATVQTRLFTKSEVAVCQPG